MFFTMLQAAKFSEVDIEKRNLIPAYLENLHIGYVQPRDFCQGDMGDFFLDGRTKDDLLFEAEVLYEREILQNMIMPKSGYDNPKTGEKPFFEIEFIKTRNEKPKAIEVIFNGVGRIASKDPLEEMLVAPK